MVEPESKFALRVTLLYVLFSGLWILLSDRILEFFVSDPHLLSRLQTYKGEIFVAVSAFLLFGYLRTEIRERDRTEKARQQSQARYRMLVEQASDGIFLLDLEGNFLDVNSRACTMLGYSKAELLERNVNDLIPMEDQPDLGQNQEALLAGRRVLNERRLVCKDGCLLPVEISAKLLEDGIVQGIVRDISERKEAEQLIRRQLDRLSSLRTIDIAITSNLDLRVTFGVILDQVISRLKVDAASILTYNKETQTLEYTAGRGFKTAKVRESRIGLGEGIAGHVALEQNLLSMNAIKNGNGGFLCKELLVEEQFVAYRGIPLVVKDELKGVLEIFRRKPFGEPAGWVEFLDSLAGQAAIAIENMQLYESMQRSSLELAHAYNATLEGWSRALELRDRETQGHSNRVTEMTLQLAMELGINEEEMIHVRRGTLLHDIGKMGIPDSILLKPGPLNSEEWRIMRRHPVYAFEMLSPIPYLHRALEIPYCHHERWDGSGYPRGLKGEQIPLPARVFAVVDVWDALTSDRPYRRHWQIQRVRKYIRDQSGTHFDPEVVEHFLEMMPVGTF